MLTQKQVQEINLNKRQIKLFEDTMLPLTVDKILENYDKFKWQLIAFKYLNYDNFLKLYELYRTEYEKIYSEWEIYEKEVKEYFNKTGDVDYDKHESYLKDRDYKDKRMKILLAEKFAEFYFSPNNKENFFQKKMKKIKLKKKFKEPKNV